MGSRAKLRILPIVTVKIEVGPIDPATISCWVAAQAIATRAALTIYLTDRAATIAGHDLVPGSQKDIHARDLRLLKGHAGGLDSPVAEIYDQADPLGAIGVHDAHITDGPQHERDQHAQKAESRFAYTHRLLLH